MKSFTRKTSLASKLFVFLFTVFAAWGQPGTEGHVNYLEYAESWFDVFTALPSSATQQWFRSNFYGMVVWSPFFDRRTSWFPNASVYIDLYAVPPGSWVTYAHPEWILKDPYGNWLYVAFDCGGGTCTQYAADVANPAYRAWWISQAQAVVAAGNYPGVFIDDTNMAMEVSDGWGNTVAPIDSNTGAPMSSTSWRYYIAQFTSQIRGAMPYENLMENVIWFADPTLSDPYVQQQVRSASRINLERGIASDGGLTGGTGFWSIYSFFNFVDHVHALGEAVNLGEYVLGPGGQEYGLASYFLISNGTDSLGDKSTTPLNWFSGYSVDLGPALGARSYNNGVYQRNFSRGIALLGEPGLPARTVSLPGTYQRLDGTWVNSVVLSGGQGVILQSGSSPALPAPPPPSPPPSIGVGSGWTSLGGSFNGKPVIGRNPDGRLEAFVRGGDNQLWHRWQTAAGGGWSGWSALGGIIVSNPAVISNADGRLEVFAQGSDNALWHIAQATAGGGWSGWNSLGGQLQTDPSVVVNSDGRLEVFIQGSDSGLWHIWQNAPGSSWSGWAGLGGGLAGRPVSAINADGRLEVFVRGMDSALWHIWQTSVGGGWSAWGSFSGSIGGSPAVAANADGRLEVFAQGSDKALWHIMQTAPGGGWSGWLSLSGGISVTPAVGVNSDGRLEVFISGLDNALWHIWQTSAGGGWSSWTSLSGVLADDPKVGTNSDGRLQVFVHGSDNGLWSIAQSTAGGWN